MSQIPEQNTPIEPIAPAVVPIQKNGFATAAWTFGIIGLVLFLIPYVGIVLGIVAIVCALIARRKEPLKGKGLRGLIMGIVAIPISVIALIGFMLINYYIIGNNDDNKDRARVALVQENEKKDFTMNETARIGGVDVKVTGVQRHYTPTAEEHNDRPPSGGEGEYPMTLLEDESEYVLVNAQLKLNGERVLSYGDGFYSTELNGFPSYYVKYETDQDKASKKLSETTPQNVRYVFRIEKGSADLALRYETNFFTFISPIVGTEGMPQKTLVYTIKLE